LFSFSRHVAFTFMPCCSRSCALLFASIACTLLLSPYCSYVHALLFLLLRYAAHALLLLLSCPTARSLLLLLSRLVVSFLHLAIRTLLVLLFSHPITRVFCSLSRPLLFHCLVAHYRTLMLCLVAHYRTLMLCLVAHYRTLMLCLVSWYSLPTLLCRWRSLD
jgi:hypothetical protein